MILTCETAAPLVTDAQGKELVEHGTALYPLACYEEDISAIPVPWHWHDDWEIILSVRGTVRVTTPSDTLLLRPGAAVFLDPGTLHEIGGESEGSGESCQIHSAVFHPRLIASMDSVIWQKYVEPQLRYGGAVLWEDGVPWQRDCTELFRTAWQAVAEEPLGYELTARECLSRIVLRLAEQRVPEQRPLSPGDRRNAQRIKVMLRFIQDHFSEEINLDQVAQAAMISVSECQRCFRSTINTSPWQFIKQFRLQKAADLLRETKDGVGEIGVKCGIPDPAYFTKLFRDARGVTPLQYRRLYQ